MSKNITTTTNGFESDLLVARMAVSALNLKGQRPAAVAEFLTATTDDERQAVVEHRGAGLVRRGLRQFARRFDRKGDTETADVFWALRDDIDEEDDTVFRIESEEGEVALVA